MRFDEFITLPIEEQNKIFHSAGLYEVSNPVFNNGNCLKIPDKFSELTGLTGISSVYAVGESVHFDFYVGGQEYNNHRIVCYKPDAFGKWEFQLPHIKLSLNELKGGKKVCFKPFFSYNVWVSVPVTYLRECLSNGMTLEYFFYEIDRAKEQLISIGEETIKDYINYERYYHSYLQEDATKDKNPGYIPINDCVIAKWILSKRFPNKHFSTEFIVGLYYILSTRKTSLSKEAADLLLFDMSEKSAFRKDVFLNYTVGDLRKIVFDYIDSLPEYPYYRYKQRINELYYNERQKLRKEFLKKYEISEDVLDDTWDLSRLVNDF